mgnify:CR=1 FL=1
MAVDQVGTEEIISSRDREILRALGRRVAELAARDIEREKMELWRRHNGLENVRPVIFCSPENGWGEIIRPEDLQCETGVGRAWENHLRMEIFWAEEIKDDRVTSQSFVHGMHFTETGWGVQEKRIGGDHGGAYTWEAPIRDLDDLSVLQYPDVTPDREATDRSLNLAHEVFDGILPVELHQTWIWTVGLTWTLVNLRGLEQVMLDMVENPEGLHRLMDFISKGTLHRLQKLEDAGLLFLNNRNQYVGSGGYGWTDELPAEGFDGKVRMRDLWGFAESQETVGVSPAMFGEFVFPYQMPLLEKFGLNCYGCCEPVHTRWEDLKTIPRLRRVSVSPWCDVAKMNELMGDRYILSLKPNPAPLGDSVFNEDIIRRELREKLEQARGCRVEIIMKDTHTIGGDPRRVVRWVEIAREESERAYESWNA